LGLWFSLWLWLSKRVSLQCGHEYDERAVPRDAHPEAFRDSATTTESTTASTLTTTKRRSSATTTKRHSCAATTNTAATITISINKSKNQFLSPKII
jgi:hypothetical protein|tara:strand:- start:1339 stop:1629 length:291 start_codon:yes stop_codon:yes gene_type:complete